MKSTLVQMYNQIQESRDFGNGIETGPYNPFEKLKTANLSSFEKEALLIAVLCYLMTGIDNSDYQQCLNSELAKKAKGLLYS